MDGPRDFMKQTKACEMNFKQPQNEIRLNLKPTPRNKRNKAWEKHRRRGHLPRKNMASLGNVVNKRVNIFDML
jgi:hypothetical protein